MKQIERQEFIDFIIDRFDPYHKQKLTSNSLFNGEMKIAGDDIFDLYLEIPDFLEIDREIFLEKFPFHEFFYEESEIIFSPIAIFRSILGKTRKIDEITIEKFCDLILSYNKKPGL